MARASAEQRQAARDFSEEYVRILDDRRLEEWIGLFEENALYTILPRENFDDGFALSLLLLDNNASRRDRVMCIRDVIVHQPKLIRHFVSGIHVEAEADGTLRMISNFLLMHSDLEGNSEVFAVGEYRDLLVPDGEGLKIRERLVLLDSFNIKGQIVDPL